MISDSAGHELLEIASPNVDASQPDHYTERMSRPLRTICTLSLALAAVTFQTGCGTIYTDVYSPKRSYFKAPVEVAAPTVLPSETTTTTTTVFPSAPEGLPPAPVVPDAAPAPEIPGMEAAPAPAPADPAMEAAPAAPPAMDGAAPVPAP